MENNVTPQFALLRWLEARRWLVLGVVIPLVLLTHFFAAAEIIRHSNQDFTASDQGAEMWLAALSRDSAWPRVTDGVRHPMWSWVARHVYSEDKEAFFTAGKWLNTAICLVFLAVLGVLTGRRLDPLAVATLLFLTSLSILMVRGAYFQPEPLYYIFSFAAALLAWHMLKGAGPWTYLGFGFVGGVAYLSKPSMLPFLLAFFAAFALRIVLGLFLPRPQWKLMPNIGGLILALAVLGAMLIPLARYSAEHFGKPLFNYTKYWMWMDDFMTEAWPFQDKYPGGAQLAKLPPEETPSASWYFKRHTAGDAAKRLLDGAQDVTARFFFPEKKVPLTAMIWRAPDKKWEQPLANRGVYLFVLAVLALGLAAWAWPKFFPLAIEPHNLARLAFLLTLAGIYIGLYGWYVPIGKGDRFMGSLWIPCVFFLCWLAWRLRNLQPSKLTGAIYASVHGVILLSLALQIFGIFWRFHQGICLVTRN